MTDEQTVAEMVKAIEPAQNDIRGVEALRGWDLKDPRLAELSMRAFNQVSQRTWEDE